MNTGSERSSKTKNKGLRIPFVTTLVGILIMIVALLLPYLSAVGYAAEYIEEHPNRIEVESLELTTNDFANVSVISIGKIITGIYGEDDGTVANVFVMVFCGCLVLTALFVFLKKPIVVIIFDLLSCGVFLFFSYLVKEVLIGDDKYAWGIGYYVIVIGAIALLAGAIWMLVTKINTKHQAKEAMAYNSIE